MTRGTTHFLSGMVLVVILAGCSALEVSEKSTRRAAALDGVRGINTVNLSGDEVISFGRFSGPNEVEINETIHVTQLKLDGHDRIRFLVPDNRSKEQLDTMREYLERGSEGFADALTRTLAPYLNMTDADINVDVVLASESGAFYSSKSPIRDRILVSLLVYDPLSENALDEQSAGQWWAELSDLIAHELFHLHTRLMDGEPQLVDEEAAANLFGACAAYRYGLSAGVFDQTIEHFDLAHGPEIRRYFPEIDEGRLDPDLRELNRQPHPTMRGQVLSVGVFYLLAGSNRIHPVDDRASFERIFGYCDGLAGGVPRFHAGEW